MSDRAVVEFPHPQPELRAEFLRRAALFSGDREGPEVGLALIDEAISLLSRLPPGPAIVQAKVRKHQLMLKSGRYAEAFAIAQETTASAEAAGDQRTLRVMLGRVAWHEAVTRGLAHGSPTMDRARSLLPSLEDPTGDVWLAVIWTDVLLVLGAARRRGRGGRTRRLGPRRGAGDRRLRSRPGPLQHHERVDPRRQARGGGRGPRARRRGSGRPRSRTVRSRSRAPGCAGGTHGCGDPRCRDPVARGVQRRSWTLSSSPPSPSSSCGATAPAKRGCARSRRSRCQASSTPVALLLPTLVLAARAAADLAVAGTAEHAQLLARLGDMRARAETSGAA